VDQLYKFDVSVVGGGFEHIEVITCYININRGRCRDYKIQKDINHIKITVFYNCILQYMHQYLRSTTEQTFTGYGASVKYEGPDFLHPLIDFPLSECHFD